MRMAGEDQHGLIVAGIIDARRGKVGFGGLAGSLPAGLPGRGVDGDHEALALLLVGEDHLVCEDDGGGAATVPADKRAKVLFPRPAAIMIEGRKGKVLGGGPAHINPVLVHSWRSGG